MTEAVPVQFQYSAQYISYNEYHTDGTARTSFRTTTPSAPATTDTMTTKQVNLVHVHKETSH